MDERNYTLKRKDIQLLKKIFFEIREELVVMFEQKGLIKRRRIIMDYFSLVQACYLYIVEKLSYQRLADQMALDYGIVMSDTAWKKQLKKCAPVFFEIAQELLRRRVAEKSVENINLMAIDATDIPKEGHQGTEIRLHCTFSLDTATLEQVHQTDKYGPETVKNFDLSTECCYLADKAYGKATQIEHMFQSETYFLFRISPSLIRLYSDKTCKNRLDFQKLMKNDLFETVCYVKCGQTYNEIRLIGSHLPPEERDAARKRAKEKSVKNQRHIMDVTMQYAEWLFLVTNLPNDYLCDELAALYYGRWQIELMFKRAKSQLNFHVIRKGSESYSKMVTLLWIAIACVLCCVQIDFQYASDFPYSDYNVFSLAKSLFFA